MIVAAESNKDPTKIKSTDTDKNKGKHNNRAGSTKTTNTIDESVGKETNTKTESVLKEGFGILRRKRMRRTEQGVTILVMMVRQMIARRKKNKDTITATTIVTEKEGNVEKPQTLPAIIVTMKEKILCAINVIVIDYKLDF